MTRLRWLPALACVALLLTACPPEPAGPLPALDAGADATPDATLDGAMDADGGRADGEAGPPCTSDEACTNGAYCDGDERCMPGAPGADARGCVRAATPRCADGMTCSETERRCVNARCATPDMDGDGHRALECGGDDCDDGDANRYPGRAEVCDTMNRDEDCDPATYGSRDIDGDRYIDGRCCNVEPGTDGGMPVRHCGDDCDDTHATAHPGLAETCDMLDNNCSGATDEGVLRTFHRDMDGDGFGDPMSAPMLACSPPMGFAENSRDCNDARADINPGTPEVCDAMRVDENCDGMTNPAALCNCEGDVSRMCPLPGACAAGTQRCAGGSWSACSIAPVAEACNGADDNCNGTVDDGVAITCYPDADNDGYAAAGATARRSCPVAGRDAVGGCPANLTNRAPVDAATRDCNDGAAAVSPGAAEACNGADDDCDGATDEGLRVACYRDGDNDTYAATGATATSVCPVPGRDAVGGCPLMQTNRAPTAASTSDCNDGASGINPGVPEVCDAPRVDENCDGAANPPSLCNCSGTESRACPLPGICATGTQTCMGGTWSPCSVMPAASETCNGLDDDCDGSTDEGVTTTCYVDGDNDGFAPAGAGAIQACACSSGRTSRAPVTGAVDCNDGNNAVRPTATEACNHVDDNCNGATDEGVTQMLYVDNDHDGHFSPRNQVSACPGDPYTSSAAGTDCADDVPQAYPGQGEYYPDAYLTCSGFVCAASWDYNCDRVQTPQPSRTSVPTSCDACTVLRRSCGGGYYYTGGAPPCGTSRTYYECGTSCSCRSTPLVTSRGMACR